MLSDQVKASLHGLGRKLLGGRRVQLIRWLRTRRDMARLQKADVVFISYAKAGRTWTRVMLSRLFQLKYGLPETLIIEDDNLHRHDARIPAFLFTMGNYIADRHPIGGSRSPYHDKKVMFLARHPADTAVSFYFHQRTRIKPHMRDIKRLSDAATEETIFEFMQGSEHGLDHVIAYMNQWAKALPTHRQSHLLRYEDLRADPVGELKQVADFLGEQFTGEQLRAAAEFANFERLKEKERENFFNNKRLQARDPDDPDSFKVRRGKVGGYKDYFSPAETAWIEQRIGDTLDPVFGYRP
jgi:hypothetical protein